MGSSTTGSSTASSTSTYLFTFCCNFLIIHPNDLGHLLQRRDVKLQIDTKFNVLGLAKVLKKCQTHEKKVNYELWNNSTIFEGPVHDMRPASLWFWYIKRMSGMNFFGGHIYIYIKRMSGMNFFGGGRYQVCWQELGLGPASWFKQMAAINVLHMSLILLNKTKWARIIKRMKKIKHVNY